MQPARLVVGVDAGAPQAHEAGAGGRAAPQPPLPAGLPALAVGAVLATRRRWGRSAGAPQAL